MMNKQLAVTLFISLTQVIACGSNTDNGPGGAGSSSGGAAGGSTGGAANVAGSSAAGSSGGPLSGAGGSAAGATGVAGSGGASTGGTGDLPSGTASTCLGAGCPYGQCNNSSATTCTSVYPGAVGTAAPLCKGDGQYCLGIGSPSDYHSWSVQCRGTTPTATSCTGNCVYVNVNNTAQCPGT